MDINESLQETMGNMMSTTNEDNNKAPDMMQSASSKSQDDSFISDIEEELLEGAEHLKVDEDLDVIVKSLETAIDATDSYDIEPGVVSTTKISLVEYDDSSNSLNSLINEENEATEKPAQSQQQEFNVDAMNLFDSPDIIPESPENIINQPSLLDLQMEALDYDISEVMQSNQMILEPELDSTDPLSTDINTFSSIIAEKSLENDTSSPIIIGQSQTDIKPLADEASLSLALMTPATTLLETDNINLEIDLNTDSPSIIENLLDIKEEEIIKNIQDEIESELNTENIIETSQAINLKSDDIIFDPVLEKSDPISEIIQLEPPDQMITETMTEKPDESPRKIMPETTKIADESPEMIHFKSEEDILAENLIVDTTKINVALNLEEIISDNLIETPERTTPPENFIDTILFDKINLKAKEITTSSPEKLEEEIFENLSEQINEIISETLTENIPVIPEQITDTNILLPDQMNAVVDCSKFQNKTSENENVPEKCSSDEKPSEITTELLIAENNKQLDEMQLTDEIINDKLSELKEDSKAEPDQETIKTNIADDIESNRIKRPEAQANTEKKQQTKTDSDYETELKIIGTNISELNAEINEAKSNQVNLAREIKINESSISKLQSENQAQETVTNVELTERSPSQIDLEKQTQTSALLASTSLTAAEIHEKRTLETANETQSSPPKKIKLIRQKQVQSPVQPKTTIPVKEIPSIIKDIPTTVEEKNVPIKEIPSLVKDMPASVKETPAVVKQVEEPKKIEETKSDSMKETTEPTEITSPDVKTSLKPQKLKLKRNYKPPKPAKKTKPKDATVKSLVEQNLQKETIQNVPDASFNVVESKTESIPPVGISKNHPNIESNLVDEKSKNIELKSQEEELIEETLSILQEPLIVQDNIREHKEETGNKSKETPEIVTEHNEIIEESKAIEDLEKQTKKTQDFSEIITEHRKIIKENQAIEDSEKLTTIKTQETCNLSEIITEYQTTIEDSKATDDTSETQEIPNVSELISEHKNTIEESKIFQETQELTTENNVAKEEENTDEDNKSMEIDTEKNKDVCIEEKIDLKPCASEVKIQEEEKQETTTSELFSLTSNTENIMNIVENIAEAEQDTDKEKESLSDVLKSTELSDDNEEIINNDVELNFKISDDEEILAVKSSDKDIDELHSIYSDDNTKSSATILDETIKITIDTEIHKDMIGDIEDNVDILKDDKTESNQEEILLVETKTNRDDEKMKAVEDFSKQTLEMTAQKDLITDNTSTQIHKTLESNENDENSKELISTVLKVTQNQPKDDTEESVKENISPPDTISEKSIENIEEPIEQSSFTESIETMDERVEISVKQTSDDNSETIKIDIKSQIEPSIVQENEEIKKISELTLPAQPVIFEPDKITEELQTTDAVSMKMEESNISVLKIALRSKIEKNKTTDISEENIVEIFEPSTTENSNKQSMISVQPTQINEESPEQQIKTIESTPKKSVESKSSMLKKALRSSKIEKLQNTELEQQTPENITEHFEQTSIFQSSAQQATKTIINKEYETYQVEEKCTTDTSMLKKALRSSKPEKQPSVKSLKIINLRSDPVLSVRTTPEVVSPAISSNQLKIINVKSLAESKSGSPKSTESEHEHVLSPIKIVDVRSIPDEEMIPREMKTNELVVQYRPETPTKLRISKKRTEVTKPLMVEVDDYEEPESIPKIVIKPIPTPEQRSSPKITIKPIVKPSEKKDESSSSSSSYSPRITIKPIVKTDPLKITITKQKSDDTHSILKIYHPEDEPKLSIKPVESQHSPRITIKAVKPASPKITVKPVLPPDEKNKSEESYPKVTIKPILRPEISPRMKMKSMSFESSSGVTVEPIPPPEAKLKTFAKLDETLSPKLTIKPITKTCEIVQSEDGTSNPLKLTIKPILKAEESYQSPKITIKPIIKPEEIDEETEKPPERIILKIQKSNLPSPGKSSDAKDTTSHEIKLDKIKLKLTKEGNHAQIIPRNHPGPSDLLLKRSLVAPQQSDFMMMEKRQKTEYGQEILHTPDISINLVDDSTPLKIYKPDEHVPKLTIKPIQRGDEHKDEITIVKVDKSSEDHSKFQDMLLKIQQKSDITCTATRRDDNSSDSDDVRIVEVTENHPPDPLSLNEESSSLDVMIVGEIINTNPFHNIQNTPATIVPPAPMIPVVDTPPEIQIVPQVQITTPKKRGRPRKVPLEVKPEIQGEDCIEIVRPKRQCRAPPGRSPFVVKERKPRGGGRGRGSSRGRGGRGGGTSPKEPKPLRGKALKEAKALAKLEAKRQQQQQSILDAIIIEDSTNDIPTTPSAALFDSPKKPEPTELLVSSETSEPHPEPMIDPIDKLIQLNEEILKRPPPVAVYEDETRMSADSNSRAQTPARQVLMPPSSFEGPEESQSSMHSTATTESNKNKKGRLEICDPDSAITTVDQIVEYSWSGGGPYMLQEQIAQFLGVKSFKRKYPGLNRRPVEMQERDYIREKGLVSESMCDMGLTAVPSSEILDIMYTDFQEKYEEYRKCLRDKQSKEISNKQKAVSLATSQEKNKIDYQERAVRSAANWNLNFNKARKESRKCCMDLQTFTVNYPAGTIKVPQKPPVGNYPLALVPGQFTDYYKSYSSSDLNYLPLNTVRYGPVLPNQQVYAPPAVSSDTSESESDSTSGGSDTDSSDESMSIDEEEPSGGPPVLIPVLSQMIMTTPKGRAH